MASRVNLNPAQNATLPDIPLPKSPDPNADPVTYLRSIYAVRERTRLVMEKAKKDDLRHFTVDMDKFADTASYVVAIIKVCSSNIYDLLCMCRALQLHEFLFYFQSHN